MVKTLIILSTQRSGSTMVCDDIAGTSVLGRPSEYFISVIGRIGQVSSKEMAGLISDAFDNGKTDNGITSIKIMSNQIVLIGKALVEAGLSSGKDFQEAFNNFFSDSIYLRVIRNDKVSQAVSRIMARQTSVYHTVDNISGLEGMLGNVSKQRDESDLKYDFDEIKTEVDKIIIEERFLDKFVDRFKIDVSTIHYEEVVNDRSYIHMLSKKMKVHDVQLVERRLKKISGVLAKEWVDAYKRNDLNYV